MGFFIQKTISNLHVNFFPVFKKLIYKTVNNTEKSTAGRINYNIKHAACSSRNKILMYFIGNGIQKAY